MLEFLLKKNYQVHGLIRMSATGNTKNIDHIIRSTIQTSCENSSNSNNYRLKHINLK